MRSLSRFTRDTAGAAAVEFVLWLSLLTVPILNAVDLGLYIYQKMELQIAAQAAAQFAWHNCDTTAKLPAVKNCAALTAAAVTAAAQSTTLGAKVTVSSGYPLEGYYCLTSGGALTAAGTDATLGGTPTGGTTKCTGTQTLPGDYIRVQTTFTYSPVFPNMTIGSLLNSSVTRVAWMRLN